MEQESAGTQHFFTRIGGWLQALENGALLVVDEIEDSLHPLLTRRLIEMVQDKAINTKRFCFLSFTDDIDDRFTLTVSLLMQKRFIKSIFSIGPMAGRL